MKALIKGVMILTAAVFFVGCATTNDQDDAKLVIRSLIDGSDDLMIRGDQVWFVHSSYELPGRWQGGNEPTYLNDEEWLPVWQGSNSDKYVIQDKDAALPANTAFTEETLSVTAKGGHGKVVVSEYPSADNDYTLKMQIDDRGPDGANWYRIRINW